MNGFAPLSWGSLGEWSRFMGITPAPFEVNALFMLDGILLHPAEPKKAE